VAAGTLWAYTPELAQSHQVSRAELSLPTIQVQQYSNILSTCIFLNNVSKCDTKWNGRNGEHCHQILTDILKQKQKLSHTSKNTDGYKLKWISCLCSFNSVPWFLHLARNLLHYLRTLCGWQTDRQTDTFITCTIQQMSYAISVGTEVWVHNGSTALVYTGHSLPYITSYQSHGLSSAPVSCQSVISSPGWLLL